jgi:hypothetical protein
MIFSLIWSTIVYLNNWFIPKDNQFGFQSRFYSKSRKTNVGVKPRLEAIYLDTLRFSSKRPRRCSKDCVQSLFSHIATETNRAQWNRKRAFSKGAYLRLPCSQRGKSETPDTPKKSWSTVGVLMEYRWSTDRFYNYIMPFLYCSVKHTIYSSRFRTEYFIILS